MASLPAAFIAEFIGTATLVLLGDGVVATALLTRSKGIGGGWLLITIGWGIAVFAGVNVAYTSGAHLNPAVTVGLLAAGQFKPGVGVGLLYIVAQVLGAFVGAVVVWLAYYRHYQDEQDSATILGTFSTGPAIRSLPWNVVTEVIGTFVLVFVLVGFGNGKAPSELGALPVALLVVGIGASLGGPTGYAINPARDLGPRIAHALLPIRHKGGSDWSYAWVPIVGPLVGGVLAGALSRVLLPLAS